MNPYTQCPVFETQNFFLRLVSEADAEDLLVCYSDPKAQKFFNIDGFPHNCNFNTAREMLKCIKFWLMEYSHEAYVRFAIVDKAIGKAIGTIEMFGGKTGILRLDIASKYENKSHLAEILDMCVKNFYELFKVNCIATKAASQAATRIEVLSEAGFKPGDFNGIEDYYLRQAKPIL